MFSPEKGIVKECEGKNSNSIKPSAKLKPRDLLKTTRLGVAEEVQIDSGKALTSELSQDTDPA